jgi:hypothetical protein
MAQRRRDLVAFLSKDTNHLENERWNREFWAGVSDEVKFEAAWEMVETAWKQKGNKPNELRLERTIGLFKPAPR